MNQSQEFIEASAALAKATGATPVDIKDALWRITLKINQLLKAKATLKQALDDVCGPAGEIVSGGNSPDYLPGVVRSGHGRVEYRGRFARKGE